MQGRKSGEIIEEEDEDEVEEVDGFAAPGPDEYVEEDVDLGGALGVTGLDERLRIS